MKKQIKFYIVFFLIVIAASGIGILIGVWLEQIEKVHPLYFQNSFFKTLFLIIISIFISTIIHETSHLITFLITGFKIRIVVLSFIRIYRKNKKLAIKFKGSSSIGFGGLVLPIIPKVNTQNEFNEIRRKYSIGLLVAPIISGIFGCISIILVLFYSNQIADSRQSTFFTIFFVSFFMGIYLNVVSFIKIGGMLGDYRAYRWMKHNDLYAINILMEYYIYFDNVAGICRSTILNQMLYESYSDTMDNQESIVISILDKMIHSSIAYEVSLPKIAQKYVFYYIDNIIKLKDKIKFETYALFFFHFILYIFEIDQLKAINIWEEFKENLSNNDINKYHVKQIESKLYKYNNNEYLTSLENIKVSSLDFILGDLDGYYEHEFKINKKILEEKTNN